MGRWLGGVLVAVLLSGCSVIPLWVSSNAPLPAEQKTRATLALTTGDLGRPTKPDRRVFVGIALSGGGMRAANFSAAVLLELEKLGMLRHASAISSVSGGSLTAAYYGLFGPVDGKPETAVADRWNEAVVKQRFRQDLQTHWWIRWLNPWHIVRYWSSGFDRSDIMKEVFDTYLLGTAARRRPSFADMRTGRPKILINATSLPNVKRFVFSEETFAGSGSRLDSYPLSHAVMASGAFPGAFHNVTLRNHLTPGVYDHLFDGGPSDNLGAEALVQLLDETAVKLDGCLLVLIDAYPYSMNRGLRRFDTRRLPDFLVDHNVSDSATVFLTLTRQRTLRELGMKGLPGQVSQWAHERTGYDCRVWHLTFETFFIGSIAPAVEMRKELNEHREAGRVPTAYRLEGKLERTEAEIQDILFEAANYLVRGDKLALDKACQWFADNALPACEGR